MSLHPIAPKRRPKGLRSALYAVAGALILGALSGALFGGGFAAAPTPAVAKSIAPCGAPGAPCVALGENGAPLGEYLFFAPPKDAARPAPAIIFVHGWRATPEAMAKRSQLRATAEKLGAALVLPRGERMTWAYPGSPGANRGEGRDEFAFFSAIVRDLRADPDIDGARLALSGFSMGASMVWNLACFQGSNYAAAIPMAGAFWDPIPADCPDPVKRLHHTHGTTDTVVPIAGRPIGGVARQSDAWKSFAPITKGLTRNAFTDNRGLDCAAWTSADGALHREFCRHGGGHMWKAAWIAAAWPRLGLQSD